MDVSDVSLADGLDLDRNLLDGVSHKDTITFDVLHLVKECQSQHCLKHGDYQRYRQYCSRLIRRIRRSLNFVQSTGKTRSTLQPKNVTNQLVMEANKAKKDPLRYLLIPLMEAERCWAHAMQLKQEANTEPRKKFHMVRKYQKAVKYGQSLQTICLSSPKCDARTKLETTAFAAYLTGFFNFETEKWQTANEYLNKSMTIYEKLFQAISDEEVANHYKHRCDEIKPTLRYCAFNIGDQDMSNKDLISKMKSEVAEVDDELLANKLDQLIFQTREKQSATLSEVQWLGKTIAVKQEKIRAFLLLLQDVLTSQTSKLSQLEKTLFECRDCIQLLRETNAEKNALYIYLSYLRLDLTVRRNLQLIKTLHNSSDMIRPFETIIGSLSEIQSLPLDQYFPSSAEIEKFVNQIEAKVAAIKAFRCYHIGNVSKNNWKESVALLHRSAQYCETALKDKNTPKEMIDELKQLLARAESEKFNTYASCLMKDDKTVETKVKMNTPLISRLDTYNEDNDLLTGSSYLAHFPPEFHIAFPSLEEEKANPKASGITGFVKGWLGGWRK